MPHLSETATVNLIFAQVPAGIAEENRLPSISALGKSLSGARACVNSAERLAVRAPASQLAGLAHFHRSHRDL